MFEIRKTGDDRLAIDFGGRLDAEAMRVALDELVEQSGGIENGRMLYRIHEFEFPSFAALGVEFSRFPKLITLMGRFKKVAVVAQEKWVRKVSELEGRLFPGLEIKAFCEKETEKAELWLSK